MQGADAAHVRLDLTQLGRVELHQPLDAVTDPASLQLGEPVELGVVDRDDELAAPLQRDGVLLAERFEQALTLATERRLQRAGGVVEAGMHDSRVVAALVDRDLGLLVEQRQPQARRAVEQCKR